MRKIFYISVALAMVLLTTDFVGCSDEEWEGSPEFLTTYAPRMTRAGVEGWDDDFSDIQLRNSCVPNGCAIWCLTKIYGQSYSNFNKIVSEAQKIGFVLGDTTSGLTPEQTYTIGKAVGISFNGYYNSDTSKDVIISMLTSLKKKNNSLPRKTIVFQAGHCSLGKTLIDSTISIEDVNNSESMDISQVNGLVY